MPKQIRSSAAYLALALAMAGCGGESAAGEGLSAGSEAAAAPEQAREQAAAASPGALGAAEARTLTDSALYALATADGPWTFYRNSADTLSSSPGSGHGERKLRTRYNATAATRLGPDGRVAAGAVFPDSSLIVKELYTGGSITTLAVMFKLPGSEAASEGGWVWGYFDGEGAVRRPLAERGAVCTSCHLPGVDHTRMNDSHP